jgi:dihydrofolate reductase
MGRKRYETAAKLGERFGGKTYYVFSRSKRGSAENIHFEEDPVSVARRLVHEEGRGIFPEGGGKKIVPVFLK